jgi:hypothetical protein
MYLTFQRRNVCGCAWRKRFMGIENVVVEEEYNQFDEIPSLDTEDHVWFEDQWMVASLSHE